MVFFVGVIIDNRSISHNHHQTLEFDTLGYSGTYPCFHTTSVAYQTRMLATSTDGPVLGECLADTIRVSKQDSWEIKINSQTGTIESWKVEGVSVMNKGIFPCFWRAPTDNDKGEGETGYASRWRASLLDNLSFHIESCSIQNMTDCSVKIAIVYLGIPKDQGSAFSSSERSNTIFKVDMMYTVYGSGDVILECNVCPSTELPPLPRVGVEFHVDKSLDQIKWYGRGPFECYPDRKEAAYVGVYQENVGDLHVPYIMGCTARFGYSIFGSIYGSSPPMQMSASNYSTMELDRATHNEKLVKGDTIEVHLDHKHMGVRGDDSWTRVYMINI
ncbi:hypothetical protein MKX01_041198 [Papaver californicum]|nr:hypothetical protein MKX01_041198 [Papaver californicum]